MASALSTKNKLHMSWSDSYFIPWLNETTVLDYFCDTRNPFYSVECNNQLLKMQGINPEQLSSMIGYEYQLYISKPPLYVIRKVERTSVKEVIPMSYYYILHGVVYQAPDLMSVLSSRLQMTSHYLDECLETAFTHYRYNPTKGYYWDFNQNEDEKKKEASENRPTMFQRDRVELLLQEFSHRFPPFKNQQETQPNNAGDDESNKEQENPMGPPSVQQDARDQPVEKKMKLNNR